MDSCLEQCNFAKTALMICVIACHCCAFWTGTWFSVLDATTHYPILGYFSNWLGTFHIYGFTLISGYIYAYIYQEKDGYKSFKGYLIKKAKRLLYPYIATSVLWAIPFCLLLCDYSFPDVIHSFFLGEGPAQLWFLLMLFEVSVLFRALGNFWKDKMTYGVMLVFIIYVFGLGGQMVTNNLFQIFTSCTFLLFFWIGFYLRVRNNLFVGKGKLLSNIKTLLVFVIVHSILFLLYLHLRESEATGIKIMAKLLYSVLTILGAITYVPLLMYVGSKVEKLKSTRIYSALEKNNFVMYLLHQQIIYLCLVFLEPRCHPLLTATISFIIAICSSLMISMLIRKNRIIRLALGETK